MGLFSDFISKIKGGGGGDITTYSSIGDVGFTNDYISTNQALSLSAVWSCVSLISESIASLPLHLKEKSDDGYAIINNQITEVLEYPSPFMDGVTFRQVLMVSVLLRGNGYAHISARNRRYEPTRIDFIQPELVSVTKGKDDVFYRISGIDGEIPSRDMIHIKDFSRDGIVGLSPISVHSTNIKLGLNTQTYGKELYQKGCLTTGVFEHPSTLDDGAWKRLKNDLIHRFTGLSNGATPLLLEGGLKYTPVSLSLEDAQFLGTRKFQKNEIATIFRVPPHMIGDLERSTNNNIEHQSTEFVSRCLTPYVTKLEAEFKRKLIPTSQRQTHFLDLDMKGLLRGDVAAQTAYYSGMLDRGVMSINEVRKAEGLNKCKNGDEHFVQMNMKPLIFALKPPIEK